MLPISAGHLTDLLQTIVAATTSGSADPVPASGFIHILDATLQQGGIPGTLSAAVALMATRSSFKQDSQGGVLGPVPRKITIASTQADMETALDVLSPSGVLARMIGMGALGRALDTLQSSLQIAVPHPGDAVGTAVSSRLDNPGYGGYREPILGGAVPIVHPSPLHWVRAPGAASDLVASGARGMELSCDTSVWMLGTDVVPGSAEKQLYLWDGLTWVADAGGCGVRLAVDCLGIPWVVRSDGSILHREGLRLDSHGINLALGSGAWVPVPGKAADIAIGGDGSLWIVGNQPAGGGIFPGNRLYRWDGAAWIENVGAAGTRIAVDAFGHPWVIGAGGGLSRKVDADPGNNVWEPIPAGLASDVSVASDGTVHVLESVFIVNANRGSNPNGALLKRWNGATWEQVGLSTAVVASGSSRSGLWIVLRDGQIWHGMAANPQSSPPVEPARQLVFAAGPMGDLARALSAPPVTVTWTKTSTVAARVAAGADGSVWMLGALLQAGASAQSDRRIHRWDGAAWIEDVGAGGVCLAVDATGCPWVVKSSGGVWRKTTSSPASGVWVPVPGVVATDLALGASGSAWAAGSTTAQRIELMSWNGTAWLPLWLPCPIVPGMRLSVGPDGVPWVTMPDGSVYYKGDASGTTTPWNPFAGPALHIFSFGSTNSAAGNPPLSSVRWSLGFESDAADNHPVMRWTGLQWVRMGASGVSAAGDESHGFWLVQADGTLLRGVVAPA